MSNYRNQLESYLAGLTIHAHSVLDIGGASNHICSRVLSWNVDHYDIADNGLEEGQYTFFLDLNEPESQYKMKHAYDVVFCLEVFEYIYDPVHAMRTIWNALKKDGKLYITFPFLYPVHEPIQCDYMRYTRYGAIKLLISTGFKIDKITPRTMLQDGYRDYQMFLKDETMHPAKHYERHNELGLIIEAIKI